MYKNSYNSFFYFESFIMIRQEIHFIIVFLLFGSIFASAAVLKEKPCLYGKCSYVGDPHLIPFPTWYGAPQQLYWCENPGWELFVSNSYVTIFVLVGTSHYWVIDVSYFVSCDKIIEGKTYAYCSSTC